ncbi:hypothetical protein SBA6_770019 [Candidatus Sulfopaludibacter sp. SbA6]|nr:hypothetical protein SBA6_770019 [Candidatus Sulfopaludibacter sp. SbA6]
MDHVAFGIFGSKQGISRLATSRKT